MTDISLHNQRLLTFAHESIEQELRATIGSGDWLPGAMLPSRRNLAKEHGASTGTVDRAIASLVAEGLLRTDNRRGTFVAEGNAKSLTSRNQLSENVALLFCNSSEFPQANYLCGVRAGLPDEKHLLFCDTRNDPKREADYLERMQTAAGGIICYPTCNPDNTRLLQHIIDKGIPLICLDRYPANLHANAIVTDNYQATRDAMQFLLARGHRRIACFSEDNASVSAVVERHEAYRDVLIEAESDPRRWLRKFPYSSTMSETIRRQMVQDALFTMLHQSDPPTAAFCINDGSLRLLLEVCDEQGVHVPDDLELISFSDWPQPTLRVRRSVHRIVQQAFEMGRAAAECLLAHRKPMSVDRVAAKFSEAIAST